MKAKENPSSCQEGFLVIGEGTPHPFCHIYDYTHFIITYKVQI
jgi:hypothetical protein